MGEGCPGRVLASNASDGDEELEDLASEGCGACTSDDVLPFFSADFAGDPRFLVGVTGFKDVAHLSTDAERFACRLLSAVASKWTERPLEELEDEH